MDSSLKKYRITDEAKVISVIDCYTVYRIQALRDIETTDGVVKKGDFGGWVTGYDNLKQEGDCWIGDEAIVLGDALVTDDAFVCGNAIISGCAVVYDQAVVSGQAQISGSLYGYIAIGGEAYVTDCCCVDGDVRISGVFMAKGNSVIQGGKRLVYSEVVILREGNIAGNAYIKKSKDILSLSGGGYDLSFFRNKDNSISFYCTHPNEIWIDDSNYGSGIEQFEQYANKTEIKYQYARTFKAAIPLVKAYFNIV